MRKLLSLVIPTNGIMEWLVPVIESIYSQGEDNSLFEVVVTDNGNSIEFEKKMEEYQEKYSNFIYKKTESVLFMNQIDAFKLANGEFIKFINHRSKLDNGALKKLITYVEENIDEKPITFFLNSAYNKKIKSLHESFDSYANELVNYSSWSGGISCWKSDLSEILSTNKLDNSLFPHTIFCYYYRDDRKYCINNEKLLTEIKQDDTKKGRYNVFYAFCVEYVDIINQLYLNKKISKKTLRNILRANKKFVAYLYYMYIMRKKKCSYDLNNYKNYISKSYNYYSIIALSLLIGIKKSFGKIRGVVTK